MAPVPWKLVLLRPDAISVVGTSRVISIDKSRKEVVLNEQSDVGLYEGEERLLDYDQGVVYVTDCSIFWIASSSRQEQYLQTLQIALESVVRVSGTSGGVFGTASPKVVLEVRKLTPALEKALVPNSESAVLAVEEISWECEICQYFNVGPASQISCVECGVKSTIRTLAELPVDRVACPVCTYHNKKGTLRCEICGSALPAPAAATAGELSTKVVVTKLSFRNGGQKSILHSIESALERAKWAVRTDEETPATSPRGQASLGLGVAGIIQQQNEQARAEKATLESGFADLESLESKAGELVEMAGMLCQRLSPTNPSNSTLDLSSLLAKIGIDNPVIRDPDLTNSSYIQKLSLELKDFLLKVIPSVAPETRIISLTDLFCLFNRARGYALVSPLDLLSAAELLSANPTSSLYKVKKFSRSGLLAIQELDKTDKEGQTTRLLQLLLGRIASVEGPAVQKIREPFPSSEDAARRALLLNLYGGKNHLLTFKYLSSIFKINPILVQEELLHAESLGLLCRDDNVSNLAFHLNPFR